MRHRRANALQCRGNSAPGALFAIATRTPHAKNQSPASPALRDPNNVAKSTGASLNSTPHHRPVVFQRVFLLTLSVAHWRRTKLRKYGGDRFHQNSGEAERRFFIKVQSAVFEF